jgi:recombination protein RecA
MAKELKKGKSVHINTEVSDKKDELLSALADELNKQNKEGGKVAYFLNDQEDSSAISDWISTGSSMLDLAISNRPNGGLPVGRMVELNGLEGTGKSLISAHIVANTQRKGGKAIFIDTETSAAPDFWRSLGVNLNTLLYLPRTTLEDVFDTIEKTIAYIRKNQEDTLVTIIVDSVAGVSTRAELESEHGKTGYATDKSIIISKAMRKITNIIGKYKILVVFTNQLRQNLKAVPFGDQYIVSGGKALAYHTSVRVRLNSIGKLKNKAGDTIVGNKCKAVVVKNRMGPPHRQATFDIYYDSGIADYASWLEVLKTNSIVVKFGTGFKYVTIKGEEVQFQTKDFVSTMQSNLELKNELYNKICDVRIMQYKDPNSVIVEDSILENEIDEDIVADVDEVIKSTDDE